MLQVSSGLQLAVYGLVVFDSLCVAILVPALLMRSATRRAAAAVGIALAAWFAAASALAQVGFLGGGSAAPPVAVFGLRIVVPLVIGALALAFFEPLRSLVSERENLIAIQTYRVIGGVFLVLLALNALPAVFAIPAGIGDVLIGLTALGAARSVRGGQVARAVAWNLLGLLDLVVAFAIGLAAAPGPLRLLAVTPSTAALRVLPLVLIPTFVVPLSILLHVVSLRSLAGARAAVRAVS
jgi:hypothetical protein